MRAIVEVWKPVKNYEGTYEVSNLGRVKSLERFVFRGKYYAKRLQKEKILTPNFSIKNGNYHRVSLTKDGKTKMVALHRLVAEAFIPNPENKPEVNHIDADRLNNQVENLEWVTQEENLKHAKEKGLLSKMKGEKSWCSKLTELDVIEIRKLYKSGQLNQKELAKKFQVHHTNVNSIVNYKSWKWLA